MPSIDPRAPLSSTHVNDTATEEASAAKPPPPPPAPTDTGSSVQAFEGSAVGRLLESFGETMPGGPSIPGALFQFAARKAFELLAGSEEAPAKKAAVLVMPELAITGDPKAPDLPNLERGLRSPDVATLQRALTEAGFTVPITGFFGEMTEAALRAFQQAHQSPEAQQSPPTGKVDADTWIALQGAAPQAFAPARAQDSKKQAAGEKPGPTVLDKAITTPTSPVDAPSGMKSTHLDVQWISQYDPDVELRDGDGKVIPPKWEHPEEPHALKHPRDAACGSACREMLDRSGVDPDAKRAINIADQKDKFGRIVPNPERAAQARTAIDEQLDSGRPVMVGVMWPTPKPGGNKGQADHFVVITGRGVDEDGHVYYTFHDPAASPANRGAGVDTRKENRFYVDAESGLLYRPGRESVGGYETSSRLEVSRVKVCDKKPEA